MKISRRDVIAGTAGAAVLLAGGYWIFRSRTADLMQAGPLGEQALGNPDARVTIIEYVSLTCPHCARFAEEVFPKLNERYIRTGKVRFILREFPFDALGTGAFALAHCAGAGKYFDVVERLFQTQKSWLVEEPVEPLLAALKDFGFTIDRFKDCIADRKLLDEIMWVRDRAARKFGVASTPTFFINRKEHVGSMSFDALEGILLPIL